MSYLRSNDYLLSIQTEELNSLTSKNPSVQVKAEARALGTMRSLLSQRYDVDLEFQDINPYDFTLPYKAYNRVEINFPAYDSSKTYSLNSLVIYSGNGYICTSAITIPEAFNASHWTLIGAQYDTYYAQYPKPVFDYQSPYKVGDQIFYKDKTYTCLVQSTVPSHLSVIQYSSYSNIPYINVFPDDPQNGVTYWGSGTDYSIPAGTLPTNTTYWTKGDNRCKQAIWTMVDIALYYMTPRITAQNVPNVRKINFDNAMEWLHQVSRGEINVDLPELQPENGSPIMFGGQVKRINQW